MSNTIDAIQNELAYYKKLTDELGGDNIRYDAIISSTKTEVRKFTEGINLLNTLQAQIESKTAVEDLVKITLEAVNTSLRMDKSIFLFLNEKNEFTPHHWLGIEADLEEKLKSFSYPFSQVFNDREAFLLTTKQSKLNEVDTIIQENFKLPFFIAVPIYITGKMEAVLIVGRKKEIKPFFPELNETDVKIFQSIGAFLSVSITNSNIYKILENQVNQRTLELQKTLSKVREQNEIIKQERDKSDALLLNILPEEVANELKQKGFADAQQFNHVSVMFTDFVNFTGISESLKPKELVENLNLLFSGMDKIIGKYGLEKIKTIGDAYLAVSGLPHDEENHAELTIKAAQEIIEYIKSVNSIFEIRVGINSGPVVAGIVGVKKFAYDIWGDTVNFAARMEQNSLPSRINVSQNTYKLVKDKFEFEYRGKITAKNKGDVDMYFVK